VTFNSSTATGNATGFDLETEVFANGADTEANNCVNWSNTDRGFYLGGSRIIVSDCKAVGEEVGIRVEGTNNTVTDSSRCTLTGKTAYSSGREAFWPNNSNYNSIARNTFYDCGANTSWNSIHLSNMSHL
jgi:parallel beta-helix repeat protein